MPASVIPVTGLNLGPIGSFSQTDFPLVTPRPINATDAAGPGFGDLVVLNANNTYSSLATWIGAGNNLTATTPLAFAVANVRTNTSYPFNGTATASQNGNGVYVPGSEADALSRGTINVAVNNMTGYAQFAGEGVFVRVSLNGAVPNGVVGGIEAVADGAHTVQMTNGIVFKTGIMSTDANTGKTVAQVTLLSRLIP